MQHGNSLMIFLPHHSDDNLDFVRYLIARIKSLETRRRIKIASTSISSRNINCSLIFDISFNAAFWSE